MANGQESSVSQPQPPFFHLYNWTVFTLTVIRYSDGTFKLECEVVSIFCPFNFLGKRENSMWWVCVGVLEHPHLSHKIFTAQFVINSRLYTQLAVYTILLQVTVDLYLHITSQHSFKNMAETYSQCSAFMRNFPTVTVMTVLWLLPVSSRTPQTLVFDQSLTHAECITI